MSNEIFEQIQNEVRELNNEILKICEIDEEVNQLYKGVQVFYSPVIELADVMFIGINPGQGFTTHEGNSQKVNKIEPPVINDYYDESGKYSLARIWKNIFFKDLKHPELLEKSVKTNCYFFSTSSVDNLNALKRRLANKKYLGNRLEEKSLEWTKLLIDTIQPLILICEGAEAYRFVQKALNVTLDKNEKVFRYNETSYICGFWRRYSYFQNEDEIIYVLSNLIEELKEFNQL